ncbi:MAG: nucleotide-binding universal stress UspA family protein [Pseudoalteromonas distincta]|jgi:nucleotide-binding universal stress UspA family protein
MSISTILVPVEAEPQPDARLALAVDLANQLDAKLIGVGAEPYRSAFDSSGYAGDGPAYGAGPLIVAQLASIEADLERAEAKFRATATAVRQGCEWRAQMQAPLQKLAAEARAADLIVIGRSMARTGRDDGLALAGPLVLSAGRPVLMTPPGATQIRLSSIVIAWKERREARRAVIDAVPFLQRAQSVHVVEICAHPDEAAEAMVRLTDLAAHLVRHGVEATVETALEDRGSDPVEQVLGVATRCKADLIVAGAYGHSRLQERVFGGFTRALLTQTDRAVLLSH